MTAVPPLQLRCPAGHSFDVNKRGYLTALPNGSKFHGDDAPMLDARDRVHRSGFFRPLADALVDAAGTAPERVIDAGSGPGHYLAAILDRHPAARGLAMDLSPTAAARAVRAHPGVDGVVIDTWQPWPVVDGVADVVLDVFAPRNHAEFRRVLRPGGRLVVAVPTAQHLAELRLGGRMLDIPADKSDALTEALADDYRDTVVTRVEARSLITGGILDALIAMGPTAHHRNADELPDELEVTLSVDVLVFTR